MTFIKPSITRIPTSHVERKFRARGTIPLPFILTGLGSSSAVSLDALTVYTGYGYTYKDVYTKPYRLSKMDLYLLKGERDIVSGFERCIFRDKVDRMPELNLFRSHGLSMTATRPLSEEFNKWLCQKIEKNS